MANLTANLRGLKVSAVGMNGGVNHADLRQWSSVATFGSLSISVAATMEASTKPSPRS